MKKIIKKHYHWTIALVMLLQMGIYVGLMNNDSLFILPVSEELGISRSAFSLTFSLRNFVGFLMLMISGPLVKRFGYRKMVILALPLAGLGYYTFSRSHELITLYIGAILLGISEGFCGSSSVNRVINDWFHRHRGVVVGAVSAASGLGGSLCCTALSAAMEKGSWRSSYLLSMALMAVLLLLNICAVRDEPKKMGLEPYGEGELLKKAKSEGLPLRLFQGYSFRDLLRRPIFYLAILVMLVTYVSVYLPNSAIVAHMRDRGLSEVQAVQMQSMRLLLLTVSKVLCGFLMDVIGARWVTLLCVACGAASMWLLPLITDTNLAIIAIILYSCALPITTITIPLLTMDMFGYHSYIIAVGVFSSLVNAGNMLAGPIVNIVFDKLGSYSPAFRVGAIVMLLMIGAYLILYYLAKQERNMWNKQFGNI